MAIAGRVLGGGLNGNVGVIQTMVAELVTNPDHEPKAYAIMPFVWSVGIIVGPAVGGYFATPARSFPGSALDIDLFHRFPYLLPNLICSSLLLISIIAGFFCLEETHPDMQPWSMSKERKNSHVAAGQMATQYTTSQPSADISRGSYGTFNAVEEEAVEEEWLLRPDGTVRTVDRPESISSTAGNTVYTRRIIVLMVALGIFTYCSMTYDHLMPIFFQDDRIPAGSEMIAGLPTVGSRYGSFAGGLGLSVKDSGVILAFNGLIALFVQAVIFPLVAGWLGIWRSFILVTVLNPLAYFIVPWLALLPNDLLYPGIYTCLTIRNLFSILAYPLLLILIKEATPAPNALGKINGLAASTGGIFRTLASPIAGLLYGVGDRIQFTALAWWVTALVATVGAIQVLTINQRRKGPHHQIRPGWMPEDAEEAFRRKSSVVRIRVQGNDSGYRAQEDDERTPFASRVYRG